jgi:hypothetical protein
MKRYRAPKKEICGYLYAELGTEQVMLRCHQWREIHPQQLRIVAEMSAERGVHLDHVRTSGWQWKHQKREKFAYCIRDYSKETDVRRQRNNICWSPPVSSAAQPLFISQ